MPKFLNTPLLSAWIEKLIDETEKELVILVPYINISDKIFTKLRDANARGVETVLVYRENKLHDKVREKLMTLDNLNLLHQPNLHAKCYYNEKYLIIGSMNLYEYSEKNNREMGVLLRKEGEYEEGRYVLADDIDVFRDAIEEVRDVIKSAELEKPSRDTIENGFELDIIKTEAEKTLELCKKYNKYFINKIFEPVNLDGSYYACCKNYYDRIDVSIDYRVTIFFNLPDHHLKNIQQEFSFRYDEFMYEGFKFYWNQNSSKAHLYLDSRNRDWSRVEDGEKFNLIREALSKFMFDLKPMMAIK